MFMVTERIPFCQANEVICGMIDDFYGKVKQQAGYQKGISRVIFDESHNRFKKNRKNI